MEPIAVGRIARAHGVRGELSVEIHTEVPARFDPGAVVTLEDGTPLTVTASRPHAQRMLVTFEGVADRTAADALRGQWLFVPAGDLPELPEGSFWPHQLEGFEVLTEGGRSLGRLTDVLSAPGNDVWLVEGGDGAAPVLVPAVRDTVLAVDLEARTVVVREEGVA